MMLVFLLTLVLLAVVVSRLSTRQLPPGFSPDLERRLSEQAERVELLEQELGRLKEQADFTERLLTERSGSRPEEEGDESA